MTTSAFGVEHSEISKGYPLGSAAANAERVLSESHMAGEHAHNPMGSCRKCKLHGHAKQEPITGNARFAKSEFGVDHLAKAGIGTVLGTAARKAKDVLPGLGGQIGSATNKVNDLNGKLQPLASAIGGVKSTIGGAIGLGGRAAKGAAEGAPKTIGQKISTNKGALAAGAGAGVVGSSLFGRKNN